MDIDFDDMIGTLRKSREKIFCGKDIDCIMNTAGQVTAGPNRIGITVNKADYTTVIKFYRFRIYKIQKMIKIRRTNR